MPKPPAKKGRVFRIKTREGQVRNIEIPVGRASEPLPPEVVTASLDEISRCFHMFMVGALHPDPDQGEKLVREATTHLMHYRAEMGFFQKKHGGITDDVE